MKKIIDGKVFNTETADKLAEASGPGYTTDFCYWSEALYRTKRGAYFLHGEGNARSRWAKRVGPGEFGSGSGILPLTQKEAQRWAEKYITAEEYEAIWTPEEA